MKFAVMFFSSLHDVTDDYMEQCVNLLLQESNAEPSRVNVVSRKLQKFPTEVLHVAVAVEGNMNEAQTLGKIIRKRLYHDPNFLASPNDFTKPAQYVLCLRTCRFIDHYMDGEVKYLKCSQHEDALYAEVPFEYFDTIKWLNVLEPDEREKKAWILEWELSGF